MAEKDASAVAATGRTIPLVPPLYQSSVYLLPDLDAFDRISTGEEPGFLYVRDCHPNARLLAEQLAVLEGASWVLPSGSGMAAVTAVLLSVVEHGDRIVASDALHFETAHLLRHALARFGVRTTFVDARDLDAVRDALSEPARLLWVETMSNPQLRLVDIEALAAVCHERSCTLVVDNTLATPELVKPLELGADLVVESLTKMIGGHGDLTVGAVCGRGSFRAQLQAAISDWGLASHPFECWLAERGLATLSLRMQTASANASALADWLAGQRGVTRVLYPGRADHPDHALARRLLPNGFGNLLCFELAGGRDAVNRFMQQASGIPYCTSMGNLTTTCSPAIISQPSDSPVGHKRLPATGGLIRLSVGVQPLGQIRQEMARGLAEKVPGQARAEGAAID